MADMSLAADRPLNWNLLGSLASEEIYEQQLQASDLAAGRGAHVVALTLPDMMRMRSTTLLPGLPGLAGGAATRRRRAPGRGRRPRRPGPPAGRGRARWPDRSMGVLSDFAPHGGGRPRLGVGRAGRWPRSPPPGAPTSSTCSSTWSSSRASPSSSCCPRSPRHSGAADEGWAARTAVWRDPRVMLGGSDAGAHLDLMCHANYPTVVLGEVVRDRGLLSVEEAVEMMTDRPGPPLRPAPPGPDRRGVARRSGRLRSRPRWPRWPATVVARPARRR